MSDKTVLIIDDTPDHISVMKAALDGVKVKAATSGEKGLAACAKALPDLVLLDVHMPEMDGWQTLLELRKSYGIAELPVVMASSTRTDADHVKALELGAQDFVVKPLGPEDREKLLTGYLS